jgi:hypothetical protein
VNRQTLIVLLSLYSHEKWVCGTNKKNIQRRFIWLDHTNYNKGWAKKNKST